MTSPKAGQTAWERWELASFNEPGNGATIVAGKPGATPAPTKSAAQLAQEAELAAIRDKARQEGLAQGRDEGRKAGYDAGLAEGRKAGEAQGEKLGREQAARLSKAVQKLDSQIAALDDAVADELVTLALEVARKMVVDIHTVHPEVVADVVRAALAQMPLHHAVVQLHPDDVALVRQVAGEQLSHAGHRLQESPALARGDVIIEAAGSHLDGTLAGRWQRVIESLGHDSPWFAPRIAPAEAPGTVASGAQAPTAAPPASQAGSASNATPNTGDTDASA